MRIRSVEERDLDGISAVMQQVGWRPFSARRWRRDWDENPGVDADRPAPLRGWVLEDEDKIRGFMGNLVQAFNWKGETLRVANAWGFVVEPEARGKSMQLALAFSRQPNVDMVITTSATPKVPEILQLLKFERLPVQGFDVGLYWITGASGAVASMLRRRGQPLALARTAGAVLAPVFSLESIVLGRRPVKPQRSGITLGSIDPADIDAAFDELWQAKSREAPRLAAVRSAAVLRWHFSSEGRGHPSRILTASEQGRLVGYAALVRSDHAEVGMTRVQIADLVARDDDADVIRALLAGAHACALDQRVHMLELLGHPEAVRRIALEGRPRLWQKPAFPYLFKARDPELHAALRSADAWYPTLLDGDACLEAV